MCTFEIGIIKLVLFSHLASLSDGDCIGEN